jgi:hypothetical protein
MGGSGLEFHPVEGFGVSDVAPWSFSYSNMN